MPEFDMIIARKIFFPNFGPRLLRLCQTEFSKLVSVVIIAALFRYMLSMHAHLSISKH